MNLLNSILKPERTVTPRIWTCAFLLSAGVFGVASLEAQEKVPNKPPASDAAQGQDENQAKYEKFTKLLSGSRLVGTFTIKGREDDKPRVEEYEIAEVKKLPRGDFWQFKARIKYADNDYTVPLSLEVKWAGDTPMIQLTDFSILGQGPFSARVMFYDGMYAGTWSHGEVGGHMFGRVEPMEKSKDEESSDEKQTDGNSGGNDGDGK